MTSNLSANIKTLISTDYKTVRTIDNSHCNTRSDGCAPKTERVSSQPPIQRRNSLARAIALVLLAGAVAVPAWAATLQGQRFIDSPPIAEKPLNEAKEPIDTTRGYVVFQPLNKPELSKFSTPTIMGRYSMQLADGTYEIWQSADSAILTDSQLKSVQWGNTENANKTLKITVSGETITDTDTGGAIEGGIIDFPVPDFGNPSTISSDISIECDETNALDREIICGTGATLPATLSCNPVYTGITTWPNTIAEFKSKRVFIYGEVAVTNFPLGMAKVMSLCNHGILKSDASGNDVKIQFASIFANFEDGKIEGAHAVSEVKNGASIQIQGRENNSSVGTTTGKVLNKGTIVAGNAFTHSVDGMQAFTFTQSVSVGGNISIDTASTYQYGNLLAGQGSEIRFSDSGAAWNWEHAAGNGTPPMTWRGVWAGGGQLWREVWAGGGRPNLTTPSSEGGNVTVSGQVTNIGNPSSSAGGKGGSPVIVNWDNCGNNPTQNQMWCVNEIEGAKGGSLKFLTSSVLANGGRTEVGTTRNGIALKGDSVYVEPNIVEISGNISIVADEDVVIFGGDNHVLRITNLKNEAIIAGRNIILAVGSGGTIDLRGISTKAFKAVGKIEIYSDNLVLDEDVMIEDLVSSGVVVRGGNKIIYHATFTGTQGVAGKTDETVPVQLTLHNGGPKVDTYTLSATSQNGWAVSGLPATVTIDGLNQTELNFNITLPAEGNDVITVTATSQADSTVVATTQIQATVEKPVVVEPPVVVDPPVVGKYTTHGTLKDNAGSPLANVTIQVGDKIVTTDAAGNWKVEGLTEGDYTVKGALENFTCLSDVALGNEMYQQEVICKQISSLKVTAKSTPFNAMYQGGKLSYLITATNGSDKTATGVVINNLNLPKDVEVLGLKALDGGECDVTSVSCALPDLTPGSSARVQLELGNVAAGQFHHNIALNATGFPTDQVSTWKPVKPYLSTSVACTPNPVVMLSELHCTATAELSSFAPTPTATGVKLQFTPSAGTQLKAASTDHGQCEMQDGKAMCDLNDLSIVGATQISKAAVELDLKLVDAGLLVLTSEAKLTATGYAEHLAKSRTQIMIPKDFKADLILVIDTTYSMNKFINGVIKGLEQFIESSMKDKDPATAPLTVLVEFKDDVRIVTPPTRDMNAVLTALRGLKVGGGGTCPEASVEAFNLGADYLTDNGVISIVTNAPPYPDANIDALKQRVTDMTGKGAKVFILYNPECDVKSEVNQDNGGLDGVGTDSLPTTP